MVKRILSYVAFLVSIVSPLSGMQYVQTIKQALCERFYKQPEYSINLMWINKKLNPVQADIHPIDKDEEVKKHLSEWAKGNPKSEVCYWYDSAMTSPEAVKHTKEYIDTQNKKKSGASIQLKDIRSVPAVSKNTDVFSDKVPVYFRADLARVVAGMHTVKKTKKPFVYADVDVTPMKEEELFDSQTKRYLDQYGIVMDANGSDTFENSFYILGNNSEFNKTMKKALVKPSVAYARAHFNAKDNINPQFVYYIHNIMFCMYYQIKGWGTTLYTKPYAGYKTYDFEKYGFDKLNSWSIKGKNRTRSICFRPNNVNEVIMKAGSIWAPTKKMQSPPRNGNYYDQDNK